jgi:hypothetical protein
VVFPSRQEEAPGKRAGQRRRRRVRRCGARLSGAEFAPGFVGGDGARHHPENFAELSLGHFQAPADFLIRLPISVLSMVMDRI